MTTFFKRLCGVRFVELVPSIGETPSLRLPKLPKTLWSPQTHQVHMREHLHTPTHNMNLLFCCIVFFLSFCNFNNDYRCFHALSKEVASQFSQQLTIAMLNTVVFQSCLMCYGWKSFLSHLGIKLHQNIYYILFNKYNININLCTLFGISQRLV